MSERHVRGSSIFASQGLNPLRYYGALLVVETLAREDGFIQWTLYIATSGDHDAARASPRGGSDKPTFGRIHITCAKSQSYKARLGMISRWEILPKIS